MSNDADVRLLVMRMPCLLVTAAVIVLAVDLSAAAHSVCSVDSQTTAVQCVNRSLLEMPASLPADTRTLDLSHNHISHITAHDTGQLSAVEVIHLQHNVLSVISNDAFVNCTSLHSLYLDHNLLSSVRFISGTCLQELHISFNRIITLETGGEIVLPVTAVDLSFNSLSYFNSSCLSSLQNARMLNLSHNLIETLLLDDAAVLSSSRVRHLDVSSNGLQRLSLCSDCYSYNLQHLDVSSNHLQHVESSWCELLPNLTVFIVSENPVSIVAPGTFRHCASLHTLHLSNLLIEQLDAGLFRGLTHLRRLRLDRNSRLISLQQRSFQYLDKLVELDLSGCSLTWLDSLLPESLSVIKLANNPWQCGCDAAELLLQLSERAVSVSDDAVCLSPVSVRGQYLVNVSLTMMDECHAARLGTGQQTVWVRIGTELLVHCNATGDPPVNITWLWKRNGNIVPVGHVESESNILVLRTGSLYVASVNRATAGLYYCIVSNQFGSETMVVSVRLSSGSISVTTLHSIIIGLLSAAGFFLIAVVIGIVRYLAYLCSTKERRKRKSIRAVLESIQDYKCAQFDRFSAYRSAKMGQLSAFKSAKIEQLSAFRDARVDRLRTYKQATVASILTHLDRMREHYAAQTARIKDNCAQQADRLRERYTARCGRFKNYRSHHVDKMRENYAAQAARIREYGIVQMSRLREQYKTQQQHVLKLVELLDVGSCVSGVIEAECMKAESMIFDADIAFDFEAQPAHANESLIGTHADVASHFVTASDSDLSVSSAEYNVTCIADVSMTAVKTSAADDVGGVLAVASDVHRQMDLNDGRGTQCEVRLPVVDQGTILVRQSSSHTAAENSAGCVELAGDVEQMGGEPVEQDSSC